MKKKEYKHKNRLSAVLLLSLLLLSLCVYGAGRKRIDSSSVKHFDLKSYMGRWYELARFDHSFERGMTNVMTDYRLLDDGTVEVINIGMREPTDKVGLLRVSFFWIFYSDYNIMEMAQDGSWVLVGSRSPNYLWILSRTPTLPDSTMQHIIELARKRGYEVENLIIAK